MVQRARMRYQRRGGAQIYYLVLVRGYEIVAAPNTKSWTHGRGCHCTTDANRFIVGNTVDEGKCLCDLLCVVYLSPCLWELGKTERRTGEPQILLIVGTDTRFRQRSMYSTNLLHEQPAKLHGGLGHEAGASKASLIGDVGPGCSGGCSKLYPIGSCQWCDS